MASLESAFPRNEDGKPDYYGHRTEHRLQTEAAIRTEKRIEKIINWAIIAVISGAGLFFLRAALAVAVERLFPPPLVRAAMVS